MVSCAPFGSTCTIALIVRVIETANTNLYVYGMVTWQPCDYNYKRNYNWLIYRLKQSCTIFKYWYDIIYTIEVVNWEMKFEIAPSGCNRVSNLKIQALQNRQTCHVCALGKQINPQILQLLFEHSFVPAVKCLRQTPVLFFKPPKQYNNFCCAFISQSLLNSILWRFVTSLSGL